METQKKIYLDFYQLAPATKDKVKAKQDEQILHKIFASLPDVRAYKPMFTADKMIGVLGEFEKKANYIFGSMIKAQLSDIPPSYDVSSHDIAALALTDSQGLGYSTCFILDYDLNILMIETGKAGVTAGTLCRFLKYNLDMPNIDPILVIDPAEMKKLMDMNHITKFHVKIAKVEDGTIFQDNGQRSVTQIIRSANDTNTNYLEYSLSVGRKKKSLNLHTIKKFVQELVRYKQTDEVTVLTVTGREEDEEHNTSIDFVKQRLRDSIFVEKPRLNSAFSIEDRLEKMEIVYNVHRPGLVNQYKLNPISN